MTIHRCVRCGNWVRPEVAVSGYHPVWGDIVQHRRCSQMFKGTTTHHALNPNRLAAGEAFSFNDPVHGLSVYNVADILTDLCIRPRRPYLNAALPLEVSKNIMLKNEVDPDDARAIAEARRAEGTLNMPIILVEREDGQNYPIDGSHRSAYAHLMGIERIDAWILHIRETDGYRIDGMDDIDVERFSVQR